MQSPPWLETVRAISTVDFRFYAPLWNGRHCLEINIEFQLLSAVCTFLDWLNENAGMAHCIYLWKKITVLLQFLDNLISSMCKFGHIVLWRKFRSSEVREPCPQQRDWRHEAISNPKQIVIMAPLLALFTFIAQLRTFCRDTSILERRICTVPATSDTGELLSKNQV